MPVVPANCFTRRDLHQIIDRCDALYRSSGDRTLCDGFRQLQQAAANLDGIFADLREEANQHPNHKRVFDDSWPVYWQDSEINLHCSDGKITFEIGQQVIRRPHDQANIPTGRFRLRIGHEVHYGPCEQLRLLAERYLNTFGEAAQTATDGCLDGYFTGVED